jgi:hypothetical protein
MEKTLMTTKARIFAIAAATLLTATATVAQTNQTLAIYGIGASINCTAELGNLTTDVSVDTDKVLDNLEMAGMARYRYETPKWSIVTDGVYMGLGGSKNDVKLDIDLFVMEVDAGYRFSESAEVFGGLRYTDISAEVAAHAPISGDPIGAKQSETFVDPVVGVRFAKPLSEKWMVQGQGDVGGFGVGMDMQWQAMLDFGYRASDLVSLWFGYRALNQDFDESGKNDKFAMDVTYQGPQAAVAFHF